MVPLVISLLSSVDFVENNEVFEGLLALFLKRTEFTLWDAMTQDILFFFWEDEVEALVSAQMIPIDF